MKNLCLLCLVALSACQQDPKFKNPVVVRGNSVNIRAQMDSNSGVVALADIGDTLELQYLHEDGLCAVTPDARATRFKDGSKQGYIFSQYLNIPDSTLAKAKAGTLHALYSAPEAKPEHLRPSH